MDTNSNDEDKEVVKLANEVVEAKNSDIPLLMVQIKNLMDRHSQNSREMQLFKKAVWKYDLLSWCGVALKYDFSKIYNGLEVAVHIANVLCECCCTLNINESQEFSQSTLPSAVQSILHLLRIFQQRISDSLKEPHSQSKTDQELVDDLFDYLKSLVSVYPHLGISILSSNDFLRIIMDNGRSFSLSAINIAQIIIKVNRLSLGQVAKGNLLAMLDEFVYTLTVSEDNDIAAGTCRLLVSLCSARDELITTIVSRFKGLKAILSRWEDRGFNRDLHRLISFFEAGSIKNAQVATKKHAARIIWAYYMGWKTRKRMRALRHTLPNLQRSIRKKQIEKHEAEELEKTMRLNESELKVERQRSFRHTKEKQLHALEIIPAGKVTNFIQNEEHRAATIIQAHWRSFFQRKSYSAKRELRKQAVAAITIQRAVRKFLKSKKSIFSSGRISLDETVISKEDKDRHRNEIERWQTLHKRIDVPRDEAERIQNEAHEKLISYYARKTNIVKEGQKINSLLARIHTEEEILNHLPSLSDADNETIERLACNSLVVQRAAAIEHNKETKYFSLPWWKKYAIDDDAEELTRQGW